MYRATEQRRAVKSTVGKQGLQINDPCWLFVMMDQTINRKIVLLRV